MGVKVWYRARDLEQGRAFYTGVLGFEEAYHDPEWRWSRLQTGVMEIGLAEGEPEAGGVATIDVSDIKAEAEHICVEGSAPLEVSHSIPDLDAHRRGH